MGQNHSTTHFDEHIPPSHLKKTHNRIFSDFDYKNLNSFKPNNDIPKKSTSFLDNLPPKEKGPFHDDISSSYNVKSQHSIHI